MFDFMYDQRFWPNAEFWIATSTATDEGLVPASEDGSRVLVYGLGAFEGRDEICKTRMFSAWRSTTAEEAMEFLYQDDVLVRNKTDKDIVLKAAASFHEQVQRLTIAAI